MGIVVFRLSHLCVTLNRIAPPLPRCVKQRPDQEASLLACFQGSLHILSQASPWDAHCLCFVLLCSLQAPAFPQDIPFSPPWALPSQMP